MTDTDKLNALSRSLRIWGVMGYLIFFPLFFGFALRFPALDTGGWLNWAIWNGTTCGNEPCHVPPMLFVIYLTWATFAIIAARAPDQYRSFLQFTMWANLAHGTLMTAQAFSMPEIMWLKFVTDIPYVLMVSLAVWLFLPRQRGAERA